jgi:hypothetical protein
MDNKPRCTAQHVAKLIRQQFRLNVGTRMFSPEGVLFDSVRVYKGALQVRYHFTGVWFNTDHAGRFTYKDSGKPVFMEHGNPQPDQTESEFEQSAADALAESDAAELERLRDAMIEIRTLCLAGKDRGVTLAAIVRILDGAQGAQS